MTRTKPITLLLLAVLGGGVTWVLETALTSSGKPILIPPYTLGLALFAIGVIIVVLAVPVRRVARRMPNAQVDPFYATRIVMLAKASSLSGALLAGAGLSVVFYLLSRSVLPGTSIAMAIVTAIGALILLAGGMVAEYMCTIPPDDEEKPEPGTSSPRHIE